VSAVTRFVPVNVLEVSLLAVTACMGFDGLPAMLASEASFAPRRVDTHRVDNILQRKRKFHIN
jgi:hypothetical protein